MNATEIVKACGEYEDQAELLAVLNAVFAIAERPNLAAIGGANDSLRSILESLAVHDNRAGILAAIRQDAGEPEVVGGAGSSLAEIGALVGAQSQERRPSLKKTRGGK